MPGVGFIAVKLLECDCPSDRDETFDPYVAVSVKEAINTPGRLSFCSFLLMFRIAGKSDLYYNNNNNNNSNYKSNDKIMK